MRLCGNAECRVLYELEFGYCRGSGVGEPDGCSISEDGFN